MAHKFAKLSPTLASKLSRIPGLVRSHRFWVVAASATVLATASAVVVGYSSLRRVDELRAQEDRLERILARIDSWVTAYRPTTPAETLVWRQSERVLEELQEGAADPASVAAALTERAERLGISNARVRFTHSDSAAPPPESVPPGRSLGGWTLEPQMPPLQVEFTAPFSAVPEFVEALPPHVEVRDVEVVRSERSGDLVRATLTLLAYRATKS